MATPIKSASSLIVNRRLSPRSPRLLAPFQEVNGENLSPLKFHTTKSLSPNQCEEKAKNSIGINSVRSLFPEEPLTLDSPHKRDLLKHGLNNYDLLYLLGRGSFGTVIKSKYKGNIVAVKLLKLQKSSDQINEKNARDLVHKNIIKVFDVINSEQYALIIMEYYKHSKNLQQVMDENNNLLREEDVISYCLDIARGLKYCHVNNILHLDIKPKNILLCDNRICKLCDFGNSVKQFDNSQIFRYQGTVAYTAPEILKGGEPTSKCDIYSLGILIWQLVSKKNPYEFLNNEMVIYKVVKFNFRPDLNLENKYFSDLCNLCWHEEPNLRPSATEVCNFLNEIPPNFRSP